MMESADRLRATLRELRFPARRWQLIAQSQCYGADDMRTRVLHGPEDYPAVPPTYRLWFWPRDVQRAVGELNLTPTGRPLSLKPLGHARRCYQLGA